MESGASPAGAGCSLPHPNPHLYSTVLSCSLQAPMEKLLVVARDAAPFYEYNL